MKDYTFKFDLGQKVYIVTDIGVPIYKKCLVCQGKKKLTVNQDTLNEYTFQCPNCHGNGKTYQYTEKDYRIDSLTIGEQQARRTHNKVEERYMCKETGIGSGTLYPADILYATEDEAQKVIDGLQNIVKDEEL